LACIPADRYTFGLAGSLSIAENYCVGRVGDGCYGGWAWVRTDRMSADASAAVKAFDIAGSRKGAKAGLLSGGNAQKLVIAREFAGNPKVILAHTPTHGLDVRACSVVHENLLTARDRGVAVLLISEDLDEIIALSDRVGVMNRGRIVSEFTCPVDRHKIGEAMVGHA
jgi:simple sugar transport system ATP-binding protein